MKKLSKKDLKSINGGKSKLNPVENLIMKAYIKAITIAYS
ncbi:bacteriocin [Mammaliicoccus sciuri]|nr:bacteriocin [Mammaliicoccus sciuri]UXU84299.1 bacteriocin [Mammaliicoccus sciuri]UXU94148.1 bacteriocin [Mammaliicoccus sciuri]UXV16096.1 bacteriocin [Mammaliicoccus sciuri]UXV24358.1 bacteriocin [Mammaliicoccus sciuri]UXV27141.1 bacteriocin [Mammaliicoccus sciuri]